MAPEVAARNFGDTYRFNMLEPVAKGMGLDTSSLSTLWKDKALVELNVAVLHSFQVRDRSGREETVYIIEIFPRKLK